MREYRQVAAYPTDLGGVLLGAFAVIWAVREVETAHWGELR
jgi:hypothetical protein